MSAVWIYLILINAAAYLLIAEDKARARRGGRRISERTLLLAAAVGGSPGAWIAMRTRRHKTKHAAFALGIPLMCLVHAGLFIWLWSR